MKVSSVFQLAVAIGIYAFASEAVALFRDDPQVIEIGSNALRYQCFSLPLLGFIILMNMFLQNIRKVVPASILATARQGLVYPCFADSFPNASAVGAGIGTAGVGYSYLYSGDSPQPARAQRIENSNWECRGESAGRKNTEVIVSLRISR